MSDSGKCPKCKNEDLEYESMELGSSGDVIFYPVTCKNCGFSGKAVIPEQFLVVDDSYRPVRRRLHDTQPSKGSVRYPYSSGNFKGIRKGTLCKFGQICGGTKNNVWIRDGSNKRIGRALSKIWWLSHGFKTSIPPPIKIGGLLEVTL